jgi:hypothetical protein
MVKRASSINSSQTRYSQKCIIHQLITNKVQSKVHHPSTHHQQGMVKRASYPSYRPSILNKTYVFSDLSLSKIWNCCVPL